MSRDDVIAIILTNGYMIFGESAESEDWQTFAENVADSLVQKGKQD